MPIKTNTPVIIPPTAELVADNLWVQRLAVNAENRLAGPTDAEYDLATYTDDGEFVGPVRTFGLRDVLTLAESSDRPKLAAALAAIYEAIAEDQAIRAAAAQLPPPAGEEVE